MTLNSPLVGLKGVGPELAKKFASLKIKTISDLIDYYPRRYDDFSTITPISKIKPGPVTIRAVIKQTKGHYVRRGMHVTESVASDDGGSVRLVWFNQPYREHGLKAGEEYYISGNFELSNRRLSIMNPSVELVQEFPVNTARILPIYRETKGLSSKQIRRVMKEVVPYIRSLDETLPNWMIIDQKLLSRSEALEYIHFPKDNKELENAKERLGFEEVFALTLASLLNKYESKREHSIKVAFDETLARNFVAKLPFTLTDAQKKIIWRTYLDMQNEHPMNRLIEGDVGSGKTVVALMSALMVMNAGYQTAFMAPTELLARQHADTLHRLLEPLGLGSKVGLLVGGLTPVQKQTAYKRIKSGDISYIVGTHALIEDAVDMHKLALVVIDEQHRFGVEQRKKLMAKAGHMPHVISMTATPIPRSLALTLYGELDISLLEQKPNNRLPIITKICSPNSKKQLYEKIDLELNKGRQMFVVSPLISDSEVLSVNSAEKIYEQLRVVFKNRRVGLLHGKQKSQLKSQTMSDFVEKKLDILVSTTVIEVGVDVPNATVMLIESAERFGLAQLHQLRGRVGRSEHQGYCYLMLGDSSSPTKRLRALESSNDGFRLAELDLELRGPGAIYGTFQHGQLDLRVAKLSDIHLIATARKSAQSFIDKKESLRHYKELNRIVTKLRSVTNLN